MRDALYLLELPGHFSYVFCNVRHAGAPVLSAELYDGASYDDPVAQGADLSCLLWH